MSLPRPPTPLYAATPPLFHILAHSRGARERKGSARPRSDRTDMCIVHETDEIQVQAPSERHGWMQVAPRVRDTNYTN